MTEEEEYSTAEVLAVEGHDRRGTLGKCAFVLHCCVSNALSAKDVNFSLGRYGHLEFYGRYRGPSDSASERLDRHLKFPLKASGLLFAPASTLPAAKVLRRAARVESSPTRRTRTARRSAESNLKLGLAPARPTLASLDEAPAVLQLKRGARTALL